MTWFIKKMFARKHKHWVTLGGQCIEVKPMNLENCLSLLLRLGPYLATIERYLPDIRAALREDTGRRPDLLSAGMRALAGDMQAAPGDITRAVALLAGVAPEWLAANATAEEIVKALPALGKANDLWVLLSELRRWGTLKYQVTVVTDDVTTEETGNA